MTRSPLLLDQPDTMRSWSDAQRAAGLRVALVPTMGALHEGHLALMAEARRRADVVVVSIFVNPLQFNRPDDFTSYPRPIDEDLATCAAAGVDAVYAPTAAAMYPAGFDTFVEPGVLADAFEGAGRPGHFRGVATVVTKLFTAARPALAVFGQKDFQQLAIVRRLAADLDLGVEIIGLPTVREADGLALSSRNRRLSAEQRRAAVCVPRALAAGAAAFAAGERDSAAIEAAALAAVAAEPLARVEYLAVADVAALQPVPTVRDAAVLLAAVWFGDVRLIDNRVIGDAT